jgi:hypothetical protein
LRIPALNHTSREIGIRGAPRHPLDAVSALYSIIRHKI